MRKYRTWRRRHASLASESGFTLVELLVVMTIMGVVLAPVVTSFTTAMAAQVDQTSRFEAQEGARLALDRIRKDIHCAHGVGQPTTNASGGQSFVVTQTNVTGTAECPGLVALGASAVQWCTVPVAGATSRYRLYRENDANTNCDGTQAVFVIDYVTSSSVFSTPACTTASSPTVRVTLAVNTDPTRAPSRSYTLGDDIALRNADACP